MVERGRSSVSGLLITSYGEIGLFVTSGSFPTALKCLKISATIVLYGDLSPEHGKIQRCFRTGVVACARTIKARLTSVLMNSAYYCLFRCMGLWRIAI
jgi:hypothetical protein